MSEPSHSQSLATLVANVSLQGSSVAKNLFFVISFAKPLADASELHRCA